MIAKNPKDWHRLVTQRDNYQCQLRTSPTCKGDYSDDYFFDENGVNQYVCGDHLSTRKASPELALETQNGKTVCFPCHELRHRGIIPPGYLKPVSDEPSFVPEFTY